MAERLGHLVLCVVMLLIVQSVREPAHAHATLIETTPAAGAVVVEPPAALRLRFNEPVSVLVLRLFAPDGQALDLAGVDASDGVVTARLPSTLTPGTHVLSYRVTSADGHPVGGTLSFSIGRPGSAGAMPVTRTSEAVWCLIWVARVVLYFGLFGGVGGVVFHAMSPSNGRGRDAVTLGALIAGLAALPNLVLLQGLDGLGLALALDGAAWRLGWNGSLGTTVALACLSLICGLAARRVAPRSLALVALALTGAAMAASGHAATAPPQMVMRPGVAIHAMALAVWFGSLIPLWRLLRSEPERAALVLPRLSAVLAPVFLTLVGTGTVLAVVQLGRVSALWSTGYGLLMTAKLLMVATIVVIAAWNRWRLTPAMRVAPHITAPRMARAVALEIVLALTVFGIAAAWRFTPPPRALAMVPAFPLTAHIHTDRVMADLTLTPGRTGANDLAVVLQTGRFTPFTAREVTVLFAQPDAGMAPIERHAILGPNEVWRVADLPLVVPGQWQVTIEILVTDFEQLSLEDTIVVPR